LAAPNAAKGDPTAAAAGVPPAPGAVTEELLGLLLLAMLPSRLAGWFVPPNAWANALFPNCACAAIMAILVCCWGGGRVG
jgi:hypothetical protein